MGIRRGHSRQMPGSSLICLLSEKFWNSTQQQKTMTVEAGARWSDIDILAKKEGLCLMTYPSSKFSTVAGWISTGGYGINSFQYGHLPNRLCP